MSMGLGTRLLNKLPEIQTRARVTRLPVTGCPIHRSLDLRGGDVPSKIGIKFQPQTCCHSSMSISIRSLFSSPIETMDSPNVIP